MRHDLRGYGRSEPLPGDFSHRLDLQVILRTVQITDSALVIGCSMGGILATDYLVQHVPTARKAVLQEAAHLPNMDQPSAFRWLVEEFTPAIDADTIPVERS